MNFNDIYNQFTEIASSEDYESIMWNVFDMMNVGDWNDYYTYQDKEYTTVEEMINDNKEIQDQMIVEMNEYINN